MYSHDIAIDGDNALPLLQTSEMLDMPHIVEACKEFLASHLDLTNCWSIAHWAGMLSHPDLAEKARVYPYENFLDFYRTQTFFELDKNKVMELISSDDLQVDSEDRVGEALFRWLDVTVAERMSAAKDMLCLVRVAYLTAGFLKFLQGISSGVSFCQAIYQLLAERRHYKPRNSYQPTVVYITAPNPDHPNPVTKSVRRTGCSDPARHCRGRCYPQWRQPCRPPSELKGFMPSVVVTPDNRVAVRVCHRLYVGSHRIYVYEPVRRTWVASSDPKPRDGLSAALFCSDCNSFVLSLLNGNYCVIANNRQIDCYDAQTACWLQIRNDFLEKKKIYFWSMAHVVWQDCLYVFGGCKRKRGIDWMPVNWAFRYDPSSNKWSRLAPMPTARYTASACVGANGLIYVIGGCESHYERNAEMDDYEEVFHRLACVETYNVARNCWLKRSPMLHKRSFPRLAVVDGKVYAAGGIITKFRTNIGDWTEVVECYDERTDRWSKVHNTLPIRQYYAVAVVPQYLLQRWDDNGDEKGNEHAFIKIRNANWV
ncbi:kelch-like protein diablo isoform X2 [Paramacrobiotus metropolitanus]|nr:kelch-like protein diablo isoform X2 [Paramacrobiotus metropolitanus]